MLARNLKSLLTCNFTNEQKQPVRLYNTNETRYVPIRPNPNQGSPPIVDWSEIKSHFPNIELAITAELDFERDSSNRLLTPFRIRAQQHLEIVVQSVEASYEMISKLLHVVTEQHAENLAQHKATQESIEIVRKAVETSFRTLFELPDHDIPRMFIIVPEPTARLNPSRLVYRSYRLYFLCECGDSSGTSNSTDGSISHHMHFTNHEGYEIRTPKAFIQKYGSHMIKLLDAIKGLAAVNGFTPLAILKASGLPTQLQNAIRSTEDSKCLPGIKEITEHLQQVLNPTDGTVDANHCQVLDGVELRAIKSFLVRKDARQTLGNLYRILTPEKKIKWICRKHVQEGNDFAVLRHAIRDFGATLEKSRGRVTVQLSSKNAVKFFEKVGSESNIQELDITLDFSPSTDQIRKLRHAIKSSQVSRLIISIKTVGDKYIIPGVIRKVSGGGQLLKLFSLKKLVTPKPFRNLSIRGVPDILEEYAYGKSNQCLAYSLDLDRVSFNWDREKSRNQLLELLDWAPGLSRLRLWSGTVSEGYDMVLRLAEKSHRLTAVEITTGSEERVVVFKLNAGTIVSIDASLKASELDTVSGWGDKIESLTILLDDNYCSWEALRTILAKSPILARLELHWPVEQFSDIFQNIQSLVGPDLSLATLCLRHGTSHNPAATRTIEMLPEEERHLGFWTAYSLFGVFPAYSAIPCQLTDEQFDVFQDYYLKSEESIRLRELNLDVSMLSPQGIERLYLFLNGHHHIELRLSGSWTQYLHDLIIARFQERLTGFDMVSHLSGPSPLTNGATELTKIFKLIDATVMVPGARMRFKTDRGNTIVVSKLQDLITASFEIIQEDEPFDFVLSQRFRCLPSKLYCLDRFSDPDVIILQELVAQTPDQIRYLYLSIRGLSMESMFSLERIVRGLSSNAELKVYWDGRGDLEDSNLYAKFQFLSNVASRTHDLVLENINSLGRAFCVPAWPVATLLRTVSLRNIQVMDWLSVWLAQWITEPKIQLKSLRIEGLKGMDSSQWSPILRGMNFAALESVVLLSSRVPVEQLQDMVNRIPSSGGVLTRLEVQVDETPNKGLFGMKYVPERIPFENMVNTKVPNCEVTIDYDWTHR